MRFSTRRLGLFFFCFVLATSIIIVSYEKLNDARQTASAKDSSFRYIPKASYVKFISLGHTESAASLFWITTLIDYGGSLYSQKEYTWLTQYADIVTTLAPRFFMTYYFLGSLTPTGLKDTSDIPVLRRGHDVYPEDWRLALFLSLRLSENPNPKIDDAVSIMDKYKSSLDVPDYIRRIGLTLRIKGMPKKIALSQLLIQYTDPSLHVYRKGTALKISKLLQIQRTSENFGVLQRILDDLLAGRLSYSDAHSKLLALDSD